MIQPITKKDRNRFPQETKGKEFKLVSANGRVLGYGSKIELRKLKSRIYSAKVAQ